MDMMLDLLENMIKEGLMNVKHQKVINIIQPGNMHAKMHPILKMNVLVSKTFHWI